MSDNTANDSRQAHFMSLTGQPVFVVVAKIYLHGLICALVMYVLFAAIRAILPFFGGLESPAVRIALAAVSILLVPPLLGSLIRFAVYPLVERRVNWRGFANWDERLFNEVVRAKETAQIVLVDWPDERLRTLGVLTRTFTDESSGEQLAAVLVLSTSRTRYGYVHVCRLSDVTRTNWTIKDWQVFQLTLGSFGPANMQTVSPDD